METVELVEELLSVIEKRKEVLKIPYCRGLEDEKKRKKIECWINTEMLAKLLDLNKEKLIDGAEGERKYERPKPFENGLEGNDYEHCDLWWYSNSLSHWLEVKSFVIVRKRKRLTKGYKKDLEDDYKKMQRINGSFIFHEMVFIFNDSGNDIGELTSDIDTLYKNWNFTKDMERNYPIEDKKYMLVYLFSKKIMKF